MACPRWRGHGTPVPPAHRGARRLRQLHFETLEPRLAPDALLAGAALVSSALAGGLETDIASDEATIEEPTSSDLTADTGSSLEAYALLDDGLEEDELADFTAAVEKLDSDALHALAIDLLEQRADPSERVLGVIDAMDDAALNDFVLFQAALNNDLSLESVFADPVAEGGTTTLSSSSGIILGDAVASPGLYSRSEGGVGGLGGDLFAPMFFQPEGYYHVEVSIDNNPVGIEITGPASYVWVPPGGFSSAPVEVTPVVVAAGTYTGRVTFEDQQETDTIYVVDTTDVTPQWQRPDTGAWAAPDTFLQDGSGAPVFSTADNLRWIASFTHDVPVEAEPNYVELEAVPWDDWYLGLYDPTEPWPVVAGDSCTGDPGNSSCIAYGGPGVGDWAVRATVWYNGGPAGGGGGGGGVPARQLTPERVVVAEITYLDWVPNTGFFAGELEAYGNGYRFFPDAPTPEDDFHNDVDVLIEVAPDVDEGILVYLDQFDVDDPTDHTGIVDNDIDSNDINEPDNFGGFGSLSANQVVVYGSETVTFSTSVQPGDNFRIAAAGRQSELDHVEPLDADDESRLFFDGDSDGFFLGSADYILETPPVFGQAVVATGLFTSWRKLYVEIDKMGSVTGNIVKGQIVQVTDRGDGTHSVVFQVDPAFSPFTDSVNRFVDGRLVQGSNEWTVESSGNGDQISLIVDTSSQGGGGQQGPPPLPVVGQADLEDDDTWQDGLPLPSVNTNTLQSATDKVFIDVKFIWSIDGVNVSDILPFVQNVANEGQAKDIRKWDSAGFNKDSYWVAYVRLRRGENKELRAVGDDRLVGTRYQWLRNPYDFSDQQWREFTALRQSHLKTARAWALKEQAMNLWAYRYEKPARKHFAWWYRSRAHSRLKPMIDKAKMLKSRLANVLTYLKHPITNAMSESLNSKIGWIKYTARGFRNFANFQTAIYFHCGGLDLEPSPT